MDYMKRKTQRTVEHTVMDMNVNKKNENVSRLKSVLSALLVTGLIGLGLSLSMPESSEAQSHPTAPQRTVQDTNGPTGPQPPSPPGPPAQTPIDGGLGILLAAGGAYALRKMHMNKAE